MAWEDVVEHSPTVQAFAGALGKALRNRIDAAKLDNDRRDAALWARDAVQFWQRQMDLHPDVPYFPRYANDDGRQKDDAEVAQWRLANPSTQP